MKNLKGIIEYKVEHEPTCGEIRVTIDFDKFNDFGGEEKTPMYQCIIDMVEFWNGYQSRLEANEGDYLKTFLKQLCKMVLQVQSEYNLNLKGVISHFNKEEGYMLLDGYYGMTLISISEMELGDQDDYSIKELQLNKAS